jgi:hypothetical protein
MPTIASPVERSALFDEMWEDKRLYLHYFEV